MIRRFQNISHHLSISSSQPPPQSSQSLIPELTREITDSRCEPKEKKNHSYLPPICPIEQRVPWNSEWKEEEKKEKKKNRGREKEKWEKKKRKENKKRGGETSRREGRREIDPADKGATPDCCRIVHALSHNKDDALSLTSSEYVWQDSRWHGRNRNRGRRARAAREGARAGQGPEIKPLRQ